MTFTARGLIVFALVFVCTGCGAELAWYGHTRDRSARIEVRVDGDQQWLSIGDHRSRLYDAIALSSITTAGVGSRLVFAAMRRNAHRVERWYVIDDFVESRAWDGVGVIVLDRQGLHVAYLAQRDGQWRAVVDGHEQTAFQDIDTASLQFAPDGARVGYIAFDGSCARAVVDRAAGPCHRQLQALALGSDAAHDVLIERDHDITRMFIGDRERGEPVDEIRDLVLAPDGSAVVYTARVGSDWFVVTDAVRGPPYRAVEAPVYSADGQHVGYLGHLADTTQIVIDGVTLKTVAAAVALCLSPDGAHVAFVAPASRGFAVVVDDAAFRFDVVIEGSLRFSHDGRHWAALVGTLSERRLSIVVDGATRLRFDSEELFGGGLGGLGGREAIEALGEWVYVELERYLQQDGG